MPRGRTSEVGSETRNALGYTQVKTEDRGWVGKHILMLEEKLGRRLRPGERAIFFDGNKENLDSDNIVLAEPRTARSIKARIAKLQAEIEDRQAVIKDLEEELERSSLDE
jgi:hypothetical protein